VREAGFTVSGHFQQMGAHRVEAMMAAQPY